MLNLHLQGFYSVWMHMSSFLVTLRLRINSNHLTMLAIVHLDARNKKKGPEHLKRGKGKIIEIINLAEC